jgi:hypothetical protein
MGHPGLEPGTNRLKAEYSTIELVTRLGLAQFHAVYKGSTRAALCDTAGQLITMN